LHPKNEFFGTYVSFTIGVQNAKNEMFLPDAGSGNGCRSVGAYARAGNSRAGCGGIGNR
jgi:hypothetical protein